MPIDRVPSLDDGSFGNDEHCDVGCTEANRGQRVEPTIQSCCRGVQFVAEVKERLLVSRVERGYEVLFVACGSRNEFVPASFTGNDA